MVWLVVPIMFFAVFVQALAGFGSGLIAMPLLIAVLGLDVAAPAFALTMQIMGVMMMWRYRNSFDWSEVWRVSVAGLVMIPIGIWGAGQISETIVMVLLGIFLIGYSLFSLSGASIPMLHYKSGFGFGAVSGLLHGAYNTGGPPLVMYGTSQRWHPAKFKVNIASLFFINGIWVIIVHWLSGNITQPVLQNTALMLPTMAIGMILGVSLDRFIQPEQFRHGVFVLLLLIGISLIL